MKRSNPVWQSAASQESNEKLYLFNSFTKQKELFKPLDGNQIKWYSCGPTVYDESHMGHARTYISFDIMRRVLQDYFNYDVTYCMNITDIDDKIIIRARRQYLLDEYAKKEHKLDDLKSDINQALSLFEEKMNNEHDKDKKAMYLNMLNKCKQILAKYDDKKADESNQDMIKDMITNSTDILSNWLDKLHSKSVTDNSIFIKLPRYYEGEFHKDMSALNILPPSVLTRVSEYVPEIIKFIEKIISNGFGYESNGSVYFDTVKFDNCQDHYYAKLVPEAFGDSKALAEGEGDLCDMTQEKKNPTDFALWKNSKEGEPAWDSPWGKGRPGWHIECSAMAGAVFESQIDIHSGGQDLKFPHHDNEIAQSEAAFSNNNWVNFFLHSGHLHIQGCKMSKSLKNFVTIKDALKKYTSKQIRLLFLLHSWKDTLDYSDQGMDAALSFEKTSREFFFKVKDYSRDVKFNQPEAFAKHTEVESQLLKTFQEKKALIHKALCDSINTAQTMKEILNLISACNTYMNAHYNASHYNHILLRDIALYVTRLFRVFGVLESNDSIGYQTTGQSESINVEQVVMPYLNVLSKFRDDVRTEARTNKQTQILQMCDNLRDNVLPDLGVLMEDQGERTIIKLCDREQLMEERKQKQIMAERKKAEEQKRKEELLKAQMEKEAKKSIPPHEMFLKETDKYSKFDEKGFPILDAEGKELSKGLTKKLQKLYETQQKTYEEYLKKKADQVNEN